MTTTKSECSPTGDCPSSSLLLFPLFLHLHLQITTQLRDKDVPNKTAIEYHVRQRRRRRKGTLNTWSYFFNTVHKQLRAALSSHGIFFLVQWNLLNCLSSYCPGSYSSQLGVCSFILLSLMSLLLEHVLVIIEKKPF